MKVITKNLRNSPLVGRSVGLSRWLSGKESTCQSRRCKRCGFTPGSGRSHGEGNGNPLQYFCLENSTDRGAWWAAVLGVAKSQIWLSMHAQRGLQCCVCSCVCMCELRGRSGYGSSVIWEYKLSTEIGEKINQTSAHSLFYFSTSRHFFFFFFKLKAQIPRLGRSLGGGHGNALQYACLDNPYGQRSLVGCSPWGHKESDMIEWLKR